MKNKFTKLFTLATLITVVLSANAFAFRPIFHPPTVSILDALRNDQENFSILIGLVRESGLNELIKEGKSFTLLAPSNAAFAKLQDGTLESFKKDMTRLRQLLFNHLLPGKVLFKEMFEPDTPANEGRQTTKSVKNLNGSLAYMFCDEHKASAETVHLPLINGKARVLASDFEGKSAVIQVIDTVLMPEDNSASIGVDSGLPVRNETALGLNTTTFDTLNGTVTVNLPDDLANGDTISGTVISEPKGKTGDEQAKNQDELNGYVVEVADQSTPKEKVNGNQIDFCKDPAAKTNDYSITVCSKWSVPDAVKTVAVVLKNREGKIVSRADVPVAPKANPAKVTEGLLTPAVGQAGKPLSIKGPFDGDFASTAIKLGNQTAKFLASSPRKVVVESPRDLKGVNDIEVEYKGKTVARCTYRSISIRLAADKLNLIKGEQTSLTVTLAGLIGLLSPVSVQLSNKSPGTVSMGGGETQTVDVNPAQVNGDTFSTKRTLTGVSAGGFSISAVVERSDASGNCQSGGNIAGMPLYGPSGGLPRPHPAPQPSPSEPPTAQCQLYGEPGVSTGGVSNCCTGDVRITSVDSRFCEGLSPDLPSPGSSAPRANDRQGSETTLAFVPAWTDSRGPHGARLLMGYNGSGLLTWTISQDQGRTWSTPDKTRGNGGAGGGAVDNPAPGFNSYRGDLSVATSGARLPGVVAMVALADTVTLQYPDLVVLLVSIDGGDTFTKTSVVNDRVGIGITDQPRVTFDEADGTIWVMWRGRSSGLAGAAPFFTYVRGGHLDSSGAVTWDINGAGQQVQSNPIFSTVDYQHPRFKVFTRPGARTHTVAISGPQGAPGIVLFGSNRCIPATDGTIRNSFWQYPLGVFFAVSEDDGRHWTDLHSAVDMAQPFGLGCVGGTGGRDAVGQLIYSENRIDLARDPSNSTYLITRARAVSDPSTNTFIGQQVEVWRRSTAPGSRFTLVTVAPWSAANPWQFNPSIAARDGGQIAVSYYQTTGSGLTVEMMATGSRQGGNPGTWSAPVQLSRNTGQTARDRSLGEYDEIIAMPENVASPRTRNPDSRFWPGAFYASWSNGAGRVFAAGFTPPAH